MNALERAAIYGIMPVINIPSPDLAVPLADALEAGGLPQIEVTLRNDTAMDSIRAIKAEQPGFTAGAGTVLSVEQAQAAIDAGADFIVTPGYNPRVVEFCIGKGVPILPGCVTPAEVEAGMAAGLNTFKFFPSETLGGVKAIKALCGPYKKVRFVPTFGITMNNLAEYLACDGVACVGGVAVVAGFGSGTVENCTVTRQGISSFCSRSSAQRIAAIPQRSSSAGAVI